ncbi:MAG: Grx4 family monothiol glutaredoxin [Myxococcales bacterium]|nr:Grx4 family monothiol glutaredoxin [Myxococcales bacterium]
MSDVQSEIQRTIESAPVVLFMKGTRGTPQCGFSAQVVSMLDSLLGDYVTVNVLSSPELRQGIKDFSCWPTIPQLYIRGEFVGGCDIVREMYQTGELEQKLGHELPTPSPKIEVTPAARAAIQGAFEGAEDCLRLEIDARYQHDLSIGPKQAKDIEVDAGGILVVLDVGSARRADGVVVDLVKTPQGDAFRIDNPNEPPRVRPLSVQELKERLDSEPGLALFDVRTPEECEIAQIPGARLLDDAAQERIFGMPKDTPLYFVCHHGGRSQAAAEHFLSHGFSKVFNVTGGTDSWAREIDSSMPRY